MSLIWSTSGFTFPSTFDFVDICWADTLGLFVAVGQRWSAQTTSCVMTSPDGVTWTQQTAIAHNWISVCYSPDLTLLVAVAATGEVMTSPDGVVWTARTAAAASDWRSVCWADTLNLFVAVGQSGSTRVMTSPDGTVWTGHAGTGGNNWSSVCWSSELGLLIAAMDNSGTQRLASSTDGSSWALVTTPSVVSWIPDGIGGSSKMCWSPDLGLFVGMGRTNSPGGGDWQFFASPDGVTWTAQTTPADGLGNRTPQAVVWDADRQEFVATGGATVRLSSDGITWTTDGSSGEAQMSVAYSSGLGILAGTNASSFVVGDLFSVASIAPTSGFDTGGTAVTITGTGFAGEMRVNFDNVEATNIVVVDETTITCDTPAHVAGVVDVTVTKSASGAYRQLLAGYTYLETGFDPGMGGGAGLSPDNGSMTGGTAVTITGVNLEVGYSITFGGTLATSIVHVSDTEYTCVTPAHASGLVDVVVGPYTVEDGFTFNELSSAEFSGLIRREPAISSRDTVHVAGSFDFTSDATAEPTAGKDLTIDLGDGPIFSGTVLEKTTTFEEQTNQLVYQARTTDFIWLLNARRPFGSWTGVSATTIANYLIAVFATEFTSTGVAAALPTIDITFDGSLDFAGALTAIVNAMGVGGAWYLDGKDLHLFQDPEGGAIDPDEVTDDDPGLMKNPPLTIHEDVSQVRNRIFGKGAGATIVKAAPIGANVLELDNIDNFEETGGLAIVNGMVVRYTGKGRVSEVIYRAGAPGPITVSILDSFGNVNTGSVRALTSYKVSFVDTDGVESSLSTASTNGSPNVDPGQNSNWTVESAALGGGAVGAGVYDYILGYSGPGGSTNGSGIGNGNTVMLQGVLVAGAASRVRLRVPYLSHVANDNRITTINIWRNKSGGDEFFQIASIPNVNIAGYTTFDDVQNDASLSGANSDIVALPSGTFIARNNTGAIVYLSGIPLGPTGTTARKIYRCETQNQPDVYTLLATISDNVTTVYADNSSTHPPAYLDFNEGSTDSISDGTPAPLPPVIHLVLTGVTGVVAEIPEGAAINVWAQAESVPAQIEMATRRGGSGVREFTIVNQSLLTAELQARVDAELTLWAYPIRTVTYTHRNEKHAAGRTVTFNLVDPPLVGSFLIQEVGKTQIHEAEGLSPARACVASSVRFTLDDLLRHVRLDNDDSSTSSGTVSRSGSSQGSGGDSGVSPRILSVTGDGDVELVASAGAVAAVLAETEITASLTETTVTPGSYTSADITVDSKGRLTAAASGTGGGITDLTGDVAATGPGSAVATIANDAVTNAKAANMVADTLKGRAHGAGTGDPTDLSANQASAVLDTATDPFLRSSATPTGGITQLTGDVAAGPGSGSQAATIANDAVTNAKAANMVQSTVKGRAAAAGTGDPTDLTPNEVSTILDGATDPFLRTSAATSSGASIKKVKARMVMGV
jgi:hypothetical protein